MNDSATMHVGPLGSTVHVLHADPGTIAGLAAVDWNRHFRRVCLDPVRGLIVLMTPSGLHENLTDIFDHIVDIAGSTLTGASKALRHTRLRRPGDPPGTGLEPDAAFYVGERAKGYRDALVEGAAAAEDFVIHTPPDVVVEVEITHADEGRIGRYADLGGAGAVAAARPQGHVGTSGPTSSPFHSGARRFPWPRRRCSRGSPPTMSARRPKAFGPA